MVFFNQRGLRFHTKMIVVKLLSSKDVLITLVFQKFILALEIFHSFTQNIKSNELF